MATSVRARSLSCLGLAGTCLLGACGDEVVRLNGFSPEAATRQLELEDRLIGGPNALRIQDHHEMMTAEPHDAGTDANARYAEYIAEELLEYGFDSVETHRYDVLLPRPLERYLALVAPEFVRLPLDEPALPGDDDTQQESILPPFNAFSADGDVTAPIVYVNYGLPEDYRVLDSLGVSVEGHIVLARYGNGWRG
ncbi:MAG: N-acetylated-alpha-linked acidic dipeptidase, partial [Myxococcota bacterium]